MKQVINVMCFSMSVGLSLFSSTVYASPSRFTLSPLQVIFLSARGLAAILGTILAIILLIASVKQKLKKFDYKSEYSKLKPQDKIKIKFMDTNGKLVTKRGRITTVNHQRIVFADKRSSYQCMATDIKKITRTSKIWAILKITFFVNIVVLLILNGFSIYQLSVRTWARVLCPQGTLMGDDGRCYSCQDPSDIPAKLIDWRLADEMCPNRRFDSCMNTSYLPTSEDDNRFCFY